jgi:hypothetical protein
LDCDFAAVAPFRSSCGYKGGTLLCNIPSFELFFCVMDNKLCRLANRRCSDDRKALEKVQWSDGSIDLFLW